MFITMNTQVHASKQGNILIIDDSLEEAQVLSAILGKHGYAVRAIMSSSLAVMVAQFAPPDLILLDVKMLDIDGYEICSQLQADKVTSSIPIIFLSATYNILDNRTTLETSYIGCIRKPFQVEDVLAKVENQLTAQRI
jgi:two-component system, sensor histidine kinase and response regulator